jgi:hypothetical protein
MLRRLFSLGSAVSLLLCIVTVVLWVRTSRHYEMWCAGSADSAFATAVSGRGEIWVGINTFHHSRREGRAAVRRWQLQRMQATEEARNMEANGYKPPPIWISSNFKARVAVRPDFGINLIVPHWFLIPLLLAGSLICWRASRYRQVPHRFCRRCGYDLRATPDRCPECGTPVAQRTFVRGNEVTDHARATNNTQCHPPAGSGSQRRRFWQSASMIATGRNVTSTTSRDAQVSGIALPGFLLPARGGHRRPPA